MMDSKVFTKIIKLLPLTFTNAITWYSKPKFSSRDRSYTIMENSIVWFISKNPTTIWSILGTLVSFIKLIIIANVCNSPCDIHISKIENVFVANEKIGKSFISNVFMTMAKKHFFQKRIVKRKLNMKVLV